MGLGNLPLFNDYSLCTQTVSVFHYENDEVTKTVYEKAFLDFKQTQNIERTGSNEVNGFLLVIPGNAQACKSGDKVMLGDSVDVPTEGIPAWWRSFVPSKVDGLVVVKYVDVKYWNGEIVHTEAGG